MNMVDVKVTKSQDGLETKVESSKTERALIVYKPDNGFKFYAVKYEGGSKAPEELQGTWTGSAGAVKAVLRHLEHKPVSQRKAVNERANKRALEKEKLNGPKPDSKNG